MLNCKEATHLMSEAQDRRLALGEQVQLKAHMLICTGCRNFNRQMHLLRQACKHYIDTLSGKSSPSGSD